MESEMHFDRPDAQVFVPDGTPAGTALARTTHAAIGAHQDDIPIMAFDGILRCFGRDDRWFLAVTVTDGSGSPRRGRYAHLTDDKMRSVRAREENRAASLGKYGASIQLDYPSPAARDKASVAIVTELAAILTAAQPEVIYTHNLADSHDTHVAVALRTIAAIRRLPEPMRPRRLYGCEVWRDLDWLSASDKVVLDVSGGEELATRVLGAYESQIDGGKRYDVAALGRRAAHATFLSSREVDRMRSLIYAMDLTPLMDDGSLSPAEHVLNHVRRLRDDVADRIDRLC